MGFLGKLGPKDWDIEPTILVYRHITLRVLVWESRILLQPQSGSYVSDMLDAAKSVPSERKCPFTALRTRSSANPSVVWGLRDSGTNLGLWGRSYAVWEKNIRKS